MSFDILLHETKLAAYDDKIVHITLSLLCTTWDKVKNCLHRLVVKISEQNHHFILLTCWHVCACIVTGDIITCNFDESDISGDHGTWNARLGRRFLRPGNTSRPCELGAGYDPKTNICYSGPSRFL